MLPMVAAAWPGDALHGNRIGGFQVTRFSALVAETGWIPEWPVSHPKSARARQNAEDCRARDSQPYPYSGSGGPGSLAAAPSVMMKLFMVLSAEDELSLGSVTEASISIR